MKKIFAITLFLILLLFVLGGCTGEAFRRPRIAAPTPPAIPGPAPTPPTLTPQPTPPTIPPSIPTLTPQATPACSCSSITATNNAQIGTYLTVGGPSQAEINGISSKGIISTETALKVNGCTITVNKPTLTLNINCPGVVPPPITPGPAPPITP